MPDTYKTKKPSKFANTVYAVVAQIPAGTTMSYKEVATAAGSPRAYRRVATLMRQNYDSNIPCHRVIKHDGSPGEYNRGGASAKRARLQTEGVWI